MTACAVSAPSGGELARAGRAKLRDNMTQPAEPVGCDCAQCCPPPLTDIEAQRALRHVSNQHAVAYVLGELTLVAYQGCDDCGGWVPTFTATDQSRT